MRKNVFILVVLMLNLFNNHTKALTENPEMADNLMNSGKIYIVVGVLLIIFIGIIIFLISLERRIKNLEKK